MVGITLEKIVFNEGTEIELSPTDIVVFVGPNNMGKSQSLRDISNAISTDNGNVVVKDVKIAYHATEQLEAEVKRLSLSFPNGHNFSYRGYGYDI